MIGMEVPHIDVYKRQGLMRVIDVENYPRGAIRYIRYLAARRCPRCGAALTLSLIHI